MDIKKFIIDVLESESGNRLNSNLFKRNKIKEIEKLYPNEFERIKAEFPYCSGGRRNQQPYNEAVYRLRHGITGIVKCARCPNPVNYHTYSKGYHKFCCSRCASLDQAQNIKIERECGVKFINERCGERKRQKWKHLDHNHKTGKIRGVLCGKCNAGLGMFKDDPQRLYAALEYLKRTDGE